MAFHGGIFSEAWPSTAELGALVTVMGERASGLQLYFLQGNPDEARWVGSVEA